MENTPKPSDVRWGQTSEKTNPCIDPTADLGDILHRCSVTIPIQFEDVRGALGMSHSPIETEKIMSTLVYCCLFAEREDGKYDSVARMSFNYESAKQLESFIKKLPEQIFSP